MASDKNTTIEKDDNLTKIEDDKTFRAGFEGGGNSSGEPRRLEGKTIKLGAAVYELITRLDVLSAEADIYLISSAGAKFILKYYRPKIEPKAEVIELIKSVSGPEVVRIIETGRQAGRFYEIQEYMQHGTLADYIKNNKPVSNRFINGFIAAAQKCLSAIHSKNLIHRDIKPNNILIRSLEPLEIALSDFGISSVAEMSLHQTNLSRTVLYASPESMSGVIAKATDYWALGMILFEMVSGRNPFDGIDDKVVMFTLATKTVPGVTDLKSEFSEVIKGLLTRNPKKRWMGPELLSWLGGARDLPVYFGELSDGERQVRALRPYRFDGGDYYSLKELARPMADKWSAALRDYESGTLRAWIARELGDREALAMIEDLDADERLSLSEKLFEFCCRADADFPFIYKGIPVDGESLIKLAAKVINKSADDWQEKFLEEIFKLNIIKKYSELSGDGSFYKTFKEVIETSWHFDTAADYAIIIMLVFSDEYKKTQIDKIRYAFEDCVIFTTPPGLLREDAFKTARRIYQTGDYGMKELVLFSKMQRQDYVDKREFDSVVAAVREKFERLDEENRLKYYMQQLSDRDCKFIRELACGGEIKYSKDFYDKIIEIKKLFDSGVVIKNEEAEARPVRDNYTVVVIQAPQDGQMSSSIPPGVISGSGHCGGAGISGVDYGGPALSNNFADSGTVDSLRRLRIVFVESMVIFLVFMGLTAVFITLNNGPVSQEFFSFYTRAFLAGVLMVYIPLFEYCFSATPAKMLMGASVTDADFKKASFLSVLLRTFARAAVIFVPGAAAVEIYLLIFKNESMQAFLAADLNYFYTIILISVLFNYIFIDLSKSGSSLHDIISATRVINVQTKTNMKPEPGFNYKIAGGIGVLIICLFWLGFFMSHFNFDTLKPGPYTLYYIVEKDMNAGIKYGGGDKEIIIAASKNDFELVKYIADRRPQLVDIADDNLNTPLIFAVNKGNYETARFLIERNASVNFVNKEGNTPLIIACTSNSYKMVRLLCLKKANHGVRNIHGHTPLIIAARLGSYDIVKFLLGEGARIDYKDNEGFTALMSAVYSGDKRTVDLILAKGADWSVLDYKGNSLLHIAAFKGHSAIAEALINKGFDINAKNIADSAPPLITAIVNGNYKIALLLIERGADVNAFDGAGNSPLILAADKNLGAVAEALIARGADVNYRDAKGNTPLIIAASRSHNDMIRLLVESGADVTLKSYTGHTAFEFYTRVQNNPVNIVRRQVNRYPNRNGNTVAVPARNANDPNLNFNPKSDIQILNLLRK